jgi:malonyl-CoA decarboxylase
VDNDHLEHATGWAVCGVQGIGIPRQLLHRVKAQLRRTQPSVTAFVTLSPLPGFVTWAVAVLQSAGGGATDLVKPSSRAAIAAAVGAPDAEAALVKVLTAPTVQMLQQLEQELRPALLRLAALYICQSTSVDGRPLVPGLKPQVHCPVARFHLSNGARVQRLNWLANHTAKVRTPRTAAANSAAWYFTSDTRRRLCRGSPRVPASWSTTRTTTTWPAAR